MGGWPRPPGLMGIMMRFLGSGMVELLASVDVQSLRCGVVESGRE